MNKLVYSIPLLLLLSASSCQKPSPSSSSSGRSSVGGVGPPPLCGTDVGSASDNPYPEIGATWFLGRHKTIHYCFRIADDFGVSKKRVKRVLKESFESWRKYILGKKIHHDFEDERFPATQFSLLESCDGREDLVFYLGTEDEEVKAHRQRFVNPTAFAQRTSIDPPKGFIWMALDAAVQASTYFPNWETEGAFETMVMHEIGHLFGNDHVPGTIMANNVNEMIREKGLFLPTIDLGRELGGCRNCEVTYHNRINMTFGFVEDGIFRAFVGRDPTSAPQVTFSRSQYDRWSTLIVSDKLGEKSYPLIDDYTEYDSFDLGVKAFRVAWRGKLYSLPCKGITQYSKVNAAEGRKLLIIITTSASSYPYRFFPVEVNFADEGRRKGLVALYPPEDFGVDTSLPYRKYRSIP